VSDRGSLLDETRCGNDENCPIGGLYRTKLGKDMVKVSDRGSLLDKTWYGKGESVR
jgi:hypothetical protein